MDKAEKLIAYGCILGIIACSESRKNLNNTIIEFITWIEQKIKEEKE